VINFGANEAAFLLDVDLSRYCFWIERIVRGYDGVADVRALLGHLPKASRQKSIWQHAAAELDKAAVGADTADVAVAL